ncbi:phage Gp37/Gp68 family protein [Pseudomonas aeruginosa]|nr:phage Gp37/Gp68 family protein [Pseudomonas aeruginosa]MCS9764287.1 phage Gp37/Gp68 family protein [Pseudomonas aeruginosa]MCS9820463.1 phage Gp37/Gp68 family protein [Pseudomonas aeruginosa]MCT0241044.1 phage Gp37/Gp68 family protein [Pseudomonas aeruginosa]MCT0528497.1 phage Gp37/Gp68 family protein [Pseudomonas aeruginosa]
MSRIEAKLEHWRPMESQSKLSYENYLLPMGWKKPRLAVLTGMFDPFADAFPVEQLDRLLSVILACAVFDNRPHTFQIATRFPERMREYFASRSPAEHLKAWAVAGDKAIHCDDGDVFFSEYVCGQTCHDWDDDGGNSSGSDYKPWGYTDKLFPLPNLWLGVVVQNQADADNRLRILFETPAAIRWVHASPLIGSVDLTKLAHARLDWVVAAGEIGSHARPVNPQWVRSLRDQCASASVPFNFERWGEWAAAEEVGPDHMAFMKAQRRYAEGQLGHVHCFPEVDVARVGRRVAGRSLDGETHDAFPEGYLITSPSSSTAGAVLA